MFDNGQIYFIVLLRFSLLPNAISKQTLSHLNELGQNKSREQRNNPVKKYIYTD